MKQLFFLQGGKSAQRFQKIAKWPLRCIAFLALIALFAPIIANEKPLYVNYQGFHLFPAFGFQNGINIMNSETGIIERLQFDITDWKKLKTDYIVFALVPYSPGKSDLLNADYISPAGKQLFESEHGVVLSIPLRYRHFLGTSKAGEDVLAGLIHGTRVSFFVSLISIIIATFIGICSGAAAGYFGDHTLKITRGQLIFTLIGILPAFFYGFITRHYLITDGFEKSGFIGFVNLAISVLIFMIIIFLFFQLGNLFKTKIWLGKKINFPIDSIISRIIEIFISMPRLILIITLAAVTEPSFINLVIFLSLMVWTDIARLTRAELLRQRELDYIVAARALGYSTMRIIFHHALPNSIGPVLVTIAFTGALTILIESSLSFLGIGVPLDVVTWGSMLADGKENIEAWWLITFPGLAIFMIVIIYNMLGEGIRKALLHQQVV